MFSTGCGYKDLCTIKYTFTFIYEITIFTSIYENFDTLVYGLSNFVALIFLVRFFLCIFSYLPCIFSYLSASSNFFSDMM